MTSNLFLGKKQKSDIDTNTRNKNKKDEETYIAFVDMEKLLKI